MKKFNVRHVLLGTALAVAVPAFAQNSPAQDAQANQAPAAAATQSNPNDAGTYATGKPLQGQSKEGFWGHMNPFARKKWVARQVDPIRDRENELDQLQSKNANDIKDVDARATAGINKAMSAASQADQHAADAANRADAAHSLANNASTKTEALGTTVNNLDQYKAVNSTDVPFAKGRTVLGPKGKESLDSVAEQLNGQKGFIVEVQGYSRSGVESSQAMADAVVRYLVTEHQIPVYRIFRTGMGKNTETASNDGSQVLTNGVRVTLMQNSLGTFNAANGQQSSNAAPASTTMATNGQQ